MTGSKRFFNYVTDAGVTSAAELDESNSKAVATPGAALFPAVFTVAPLLPSGIKKRYVNAFNVGLPAQKRRFFVGTLTVFNAISAGGTIAVTDPVAGNSTWQVTSSRGEKSRIPYVGDTGQTDGTAGNT
jgi:hypothetical protein